MFHHDIAEKKSAAHVSQHIEQRAQRISIEKRAFRFSKHQARASKKSCLKARDHWFRKPQRSEKEQHQRKPRRYHEPREPANVLNKVSSGEKAVRNTQIQLAVGRQVSDFPHAEIFIQQEQGRRNRKSNQTNDRYVFVSSNRFHSALPLVYPILPR